MTHRATEGIYTEILGVPPRITYQLNTAFDYAPGDITVFLRDNGQVAVRVFPSNANIPVLGSSGVSSIPLESCAHIRNVDGWIEAFVGKLRNRLRERHIGSVELRFEPDSAALVQYLGFSAPRTWHSIKVCIGAESRKLETVTAFYSAAPGHLLSLCDKNVAVRGAPMLAILVAGAKRQSAEVQWLGLFAENYSVVDYEDSAFRPNLPKCGKLADSASGWSRSECYMLKRGVAVTLFSGPAACTEQQIALIKQAAEKKGFAYKLKVAPLNHGLILGDIVRFYGYTPATFQFLAKPIRKLESSPRSMHCLIVDTVAVLAGQFGLSVYPLLWILDWLPYMSAHREFVKVRAIEGTIASVNAIRQRRESGVAASAIAPRYTSIRPWEVSPPGQSIYYGRRLCDVPLQMPANMNAYEKAAAKLASDARPAKKRKIKDDDSD